MIYLLGFFSDISLAIEQAIRTLFGFIVGIIYNFIVVEYELFVMLSRAEFLDANFVQKIYDRVGMILGLFMMFKLIFSLIQHLIDPSKFNDGKNGFVSIIRRSIISIVLLGVVPTIFKYAFVVQNYIIGSNSGNNNVIYKLIMGDSISTNVNDFGSKLASNLYFSFYKEKTGYNLDGGVSYDENATPVFVNYDTLVKNIEGGDSFLSTVDYLMLRQNSVYVIDFNWLFSAVVGGFVVWILIMYIIQVGVRVIQLAYLQLIAPIPILSYISDPEGTFSKWVKQCMSTYLDLFFRVAILYFIVYFSSTIMNSFGNPHSVIVESLGPDVSTAMLVWAEIFIIIGLLLFGKKAPELIKDLFPNLGMSSGKFDFGLNAKKVFNDTLAAGAIGAVGGAVGAAGSNAIHGYMNVRKAFKDNGGIKSGKAWASAAGAGVKGLFSVAGGALGGANAGLRTKDITKVGDAVKVANDNREKRELKAQAGYHWYRPDKVIADKVLDFAGETTNAEKQIKTAEFRRQALQQSKQTQWSNYATSNKAAIARGNIDLSLLQSMQKFEEKGKVVWRGIDNAGKERTFTYNNGTGEFVAADGGAEIATGGASKAAASKIVIDSANIDKQIGKQGKIVKGLETANNDAKKK